MNSRQCGQRSAAASATTRAELDGGDCWVLVLWGLADFLYVSGIRKWPESGIYLIWL